MNAAREKVEREGVCRACGIGGPDRLDAAHLWDRSLGGVGFDDPDLCIPLCSRIKGGVGCHDAYDEHRLDVLPLVTVAEQLAAVRAAGGIERARARLIGRALGERRPDTVGPF